MKKVKKTSWNRTTGFVPGAMVVSNNYKSTTAPAWRTTVAQPLSIHDWSVVHELEKGTERLSVSFSVSVTLIRRCQSWDMNLKDVQKTVLFSHYTHCTVDSWNWTPWKCSMAYSRVTVNGRWWLNEDTNEACGWWPVFVPVDEKQLEL